MMKALVTGGNGFLGHYIVRHLLARQIKTVIFDKRKMTDSDYEGISSSSNLTCIQGDILDEKCLRDAMEGCSLVFHTAAIADIDETRKIPTRTIEVNILGTAKCLETAQKCDVQRFLYASSVYTGGNWGSFYGLSKTAGELLVKAYQEEFGLEYSILKYGSLYGREANHWNFIYGICKSLLTKGEYTYRNSPDSVREYIHIDDAARETVSIALSQEYINKSVLITGHQRLKIKELFDTLEEILGKKIQIHYETANPPRHYIRTPYSFERDVPIRVNLSHYIDISEGILDCLKEVQREIEVNRK
jgi:UDP-glucose 4-epimerase